MSKDVLFFDPLGPAMRSFHPVTPSVAPLQLTLARLGRVDGLLPGVSLVPVGTGVAVAEGLVADLLCVDDDGTLTVLTGIFLARSDERYDHLFAADLLQAAVEVLAWDTATLAQRLPAAARAGARAGRLRLIVPLARSSSALEKVARLLGAAVTLHIVRWEAFADEAGRTLLFQEPVAVAPLPVAPAAGTPEVPAAPAAPVAAAAAPAPTPPEPRADAAPHPAPLAGDPPATSEPEGEAEAWNTEATVQTVREADFLNQACAVDPRLEGAYRRMLAWARGNGRVAFTRAPSLLYRPWPDLPVTVLHALSGGRIELQLQDVIPQLSPATVADVQRRLRLLVGREVDPRSTVVLEPPQSLDEDIFSVLLSTLRLVAYARPASGLRRQADF